jgi:hypothetical protein
MKYRLAVEIIKIIILRLLIKEVEAYMKLKAKQVRVTIKVLELRL